MVWYNTKPWLSDNDGGPQEDMENDLTLPACLAMQQESPEGKRCTPWPP